MSANLVGQIRINDPQGYEKYLAGFLPIFERNGGELLANIKADTEVLEGEWAYPRTVIMKFPSIEHAHNWHHDSEHQAP